MTLRAHEQIGYIRIGPTNEFYDIPVNPVNFIGTRLAQMARSFQKYRFTRLQLRIMTNLPTTVGGTITSGYSSNPDYQVSIYSDIGRQIFALDGAQISNLWVHNIVRCPIRDRQKWYYIDPDSSEIMNTTQGKFLMLPTSGANITEEISVPLIIEYDIQFMGAALDTASEVPPTDVSFTFPNNTYATGNNNGLSPDIIYLNNTGLTGTDLTNYNLIYNYAKSHVNTVFVVDPEQQCPWTGNVPPNPNIISYIKFTGSLVPNNGIYLIAFNSNLISLPVPVIAPVGGKIEFPALTFYGPSPTLFQRRGLMI
jgi:hypothetical protein